MTLFQVPILTNGATHSAQQFRMMVRDLVSAAEGITEGDDLKVTQRSTPGSGVQVADGSGVIRGRANANQGHYSVCNIGTALVDISATGGSARSDMVILRVEDPEYEGDLDPVTDQICYFQVISNVSSSATTIPDGRTGIPLARIDIPSSTSTITNAMVKDIRKVATPRRDRTLFTQSPASTSTQIGGTTLVYSYFSTTAGISVPVPDWASTARVIVDVGGLRLATAAVFGNIRATFGASLTMQPVIVDDNGSGVRRLYAKCCDTFTIPDAYRGTSQLLRPQFGGSTGNAGTVAADSSSTWSYDIEFSEAPR
ncbi:hypothetical protein HY68_36900 [Streptomyces sp. AcH 505]|uniref:hypothetical protein n=1 Tax=Streptomyces sp. AcH 505 TaxID=352211 RepID=UPI00059218DD|nr:hypothetical protein HY68_36900 [Streptomyces sp. AcH 505]